METLKTNFQFIYFVKDSCWKFVFGLRSGRIGVLWSRFGADAESRREDHYTSRWTRLREWIGSITWMDWIDYGDGLDRSSRI